MGALMTRSDVRDGESRRDFVRVAAQSFVAVGCVFATWPLLGQMSPNPASPRPHRVRVDLDTIPRGDTRLIAWNGRPWFVRHRTNEEVRLAERGDGQAFADALARNAALDQKEPAIDANRTSPTHREWLVVGAACTHLGCLLRSMSAAKRLETGIGWQCPCHASRFDLSGRVLSGPARSNLSVPRYRITGRELLMGGS